MINYVKYKWSGSYVKEKSHKKLHYCYIFFAAVLFVLMKNHSENHYEIK